jgi:formate hydrogenlyase transcriptional activator
LTNYAVQSADLERRQYLLLLEFSKAIASHGNLADLFHELAGHLRQFFDFNYLSLLLHDGSRNVMRMHVLETTEPVMQNLPTEIPIEGSIAGWVWENQSPLVIHDAEQESRFSIWQAIKVTYPVRSICALPLTTAHSQLGVLSMASDRIGAFDELDLDFAQFIASQIAVAVEARRYRCQLERERDHSQLLLEINNILVSNLSSQGVASRFSRPCSL